MRSSSVTSIPVLDPIGDRNASLKTELNRSFLCAGENAFKDLVRQYLSSEPARLLLVQIAVNYLRQNKGQKIAKPMWDKILWLKAQNIGFNEGAKRLIADQNLLLTAK